MTRIDREDLTQQAEAVKHACGVLAKTCDILRAEAHGASRVLARQVRLGSVEALTTMTMGIRKAMVNVNHAEEILAFALTDLATARGEDL